MTHRVHLDYASSAPLRAPARAIMADALEGETYDPRRLYNDALTTRYLIETSREQVATLFGCDPFEVIFTSSASESLATFAYGVIVPDSRHTSQRTRVIGTPYDSEVIHETWLRDNVDIGILAGNNSATLELESLNSIASSASAITLPYAHPDTGTLQNISEVVANIRSVNPECFIHVDARLAAGNAVLTFSDMDIDAMTIEPVTFGGPAGVAALILSRKKHLTPLLAGGTQERARRSGLENALAIAGFGAACQELHKNIDNEITQSAERKQAICAALEIAGAQSLDSDSASEHTLPHITSAYFPGVAASAVVAEFNRAGINIHAGSSCGSEEFEPSKQLLPVTHDSAISESVFRISWGYATTDEDVVAFISALGSLPFAG